MPPEGFTVAVPLLPALHEAGVPVVEAVNINGCVIVTVAVAVHKFASVTVTVHVPAVKLVAVTVVCAGAGSFHKYV